MPLKHPLKIVADEEIPLVNILFGQVGDLTFKPGHKIKRSDLMNADILLVRSITTVNEALLHETSVKFVGIASAGLDHVDREWLNQHKIRWANAKGSNAKAVVEYVLSCIAALQQKNLLRHGRLRVGIIGVGTIGTLIAKYCNQLGFEIICHDPPKASFDKNFISTPLEQFYACDVITIHASLIRHGKHPSFHLINEKFLNNIKKDCVLINTARGAIVDSQALLKNKSTIACCDVWENEPNINPALLEQATIATPHIAGYSKNAKLKATLILYQKAQALFNLPPISNEDKIINLEEKKVRLEKNKDWQSMILAHYNPFHDTEIMKTKLFNNLNAIGKNFYRLRKNYVWRDEFIK